MSIQEDYPRGEWVQDVADYSWTLVDHDEVFYRAARSVGADGARHWIIAWTEFVSFQDFTGLRIGSAYESLEAAQRAIENIANLTSPSSAEQVERESSRDSQNPPDLLIEHKRRSV